MRLILYDSHLAECKIPDFFSFPRDPRASAVDRFPARDPRERVDPRTGKHFCLQSLLHNTGETAWLQYMLVVLLLKNLAAFMEPESSLLCSWELFTSPIQSQISPVHTTPSCLRSSVILSIHLYLSLPRGPFPSGFSGNNMYAFFFPLHVICPAISSSTWSR
jgi:hypothetical protein